MLLIREARKLFSTRSCMSFKSNSMNIKTNSKGNMMASEVNLALNYVFALGVSGSCDQGNAKK